MFWIMLPGVPCSITSHQISALTRISYLHRDITFFSEQNTRRPLNVSTNTSPKAEPTDMTLDLDIFFLISSHLIFRISTRLNLALADTTLFNTYPSLLPNSTTR